VRALNDGEVGKISDFQPIRRWLSDTGHALWRVRVKHYR